MAQGGAHGHMEIQDQRETFHGFLQASLWTGGLTAQAVMLLTLDGPLDDALDGGRVSEVRLVFGGMAAIVKRAAACEAAVMGQPWNEATLQRAITALASDFQPLSDMRASAHYRLQVAQNLLRRFWLESRAHNPLPPSAVNVWQREIA